MKLTWKNLAFVLLVLCAAADAKADICDYRLSTLVGAGTTSAVGTGAAAAVTVGAGMKSAGFYSLVHASSGLTMLGSTAGGASAAGTVGIMGGSAGALGTVAGILMAPAVLIGGTVVAAGTALFEGGCYFNDERITDYAEVHAIMNNIAMNSDPRRFRIVDAEGTNPHIAMKNADGSWSAFGLKDLYIVNGMLMYRDMFLNTTLGPIVFFEIAAEGAD